MTIEADGVFLASTVTGAQGGFTLQAPGAGTYTVRAEHIGYRSVRAAVEVPDTGTAWVELSSSFQPIELEGLKAEVDKECRIEPEVALRIAQLWDEVRKALTVTAFVEEQGTLLFESERWRRRLEPERLRVVEEERYSRSAFNVGSPFVSPEPERLAEDGYIQGDPATGHDYYAPDTRVLLSRSFQDRHCFGFTAEAPSDGEDRWVGIRFSPRNGSVPDIDGTLWIDAATYEPRRLDFRYTDLPYAVDARRLGGRVEFVRMPEGAWIVRRWRIRMPEVSERRVQVTRTAIPERRFEILAVLEQGGEVVRAKPFGSREEIALGTLGRVEGTVREETTGVPISGATVVLEGTAHQGRTDGQGRFALPSVPPGRYRIAWTSPALDSLDLPGAAQEIEVKKDEAAAVDATLPPAGIALLDRCNQALHPEGTGVLRGRVTAPEGGVPEGATVRVRWDVVERLEDYRVVEESTTTASLPVEPNGAWLACGVPHREELTVWPEVVDSRDRAVRLGDSFDVRLGVGAIRSLELALEPAAPVAVAVRVARPDASAIPDAEVAFPGLGLREVTDNDGEVRFDAVPPGRHVLEVRRLGLSTRVDTLEVAPNRPVVVTARLAEEAIPLPPLVVEARREIEETRRRTGSSAHAILEPGDIEAARTQGVQTVADLLEWALPAGIRIGPLIRGVNPLGTCIESTRTPRTPISGGMSARACHMIMIVVDGAQLTGIDAARYAESVHLSEIERLEYFSPQEATFRLGVGNGRGVLVIETRKR